MQGRLDGVQRRLGGLLDRLVLPVTGVREVGDHEDEDDDQGDEPRVMALSSAIHALYAVSLPVAACLAVIGGRSSALDAFEDRGNCGVVGRI